VSIAAGSRQVSVYSIKMLVADDSRTVQMFFKNIVERSMTAIELVTAENGTECERILEQGDIDVAFIDVNMPEMSGMEAVGRARFLGNKTFVTLMSGKSTAERLEVARQVRAYEYLVKPFSAADIETILRNYRQVSRRMKTLIVDDTKTMRRILRQVLERSVFRLEIDDAANGERAVARVREGGFDLVLLDFNMPGLDGLQTLEQIRAREPECKVIMISAERNEDQIRRALGLGAAAFLHKPFFAHDVDRALHAALGLKLPDLTAQLPERAPAKQPRSDVCLPDETDDAPIAGVDQAVRWGLDEQRDDKAVADAPAK
jgi:CheY-like chemotaxis protein